MVGMMQKMSPSVTPTLHTQWILNLQGPEGSLAQSIGNNGPQARSGGSGRCRDRQPAGRIQPTFLRRRPDGGGQGGLPLRQERQVERGALQRLGRGPLRTARLIGEVPPHRGGGARSPTGRRSQAGSAAPRVGWVLPHRTNQHKKSDRSSDRPRTSLSGGGSDADHHMALNIGPTAAMQPSW